MPLRRVLVQVTFVAAVCALIGAGCSSSDVKQARTVDDIFAEAKAAYDDDDWIEAQNQFDIIKLQYPASQYADDAQYYIAEINYRRGEFVLAAYNYNVIRRSFPNSEHAKTSAFKVGVCYDELALPPDRDQDYTKKAISAYTDFVAVYPADSLTLVATKKIVELRGRLAERYMLIAEHYEKTNSRKAAVIYYEAIINEYPDSEFYEPALVGKIRIQYAQTKIDECRASISLYRRTVTEPKLKDEVDEMEKGLP